MYRNTPRSFGNRSWGGNNRPARGRKVNTIHPDKFVNRAVDLPEPVEYVPTHSFSDFSLDAQIVSRITARGYTAPTPIQDEAIPQVMAGSDVIGIADTGTGKTAAFLLPLIHKILRDRSQNVLIIVPTRELACQINDEFRAFSQGLNIFSALCIGGAGFGPQLQSLKRHPNIVIGTPGRLNDHLTRRTLRLDNFRNLVVDEADRLVEMGFIKDVRTLIAQMPNDRLSLFFSATVPAEVKDLIHSFMKEPITVSVKNRETSLNVDQDVVRYADSFDKLKKLHDLLAKEELKKVLIFGRTKHGVEKLHETLLERGFTSVSIHGNKNQGQRQRALNEFKQDQAQIMVATDVAARGLDIPKVTHVINYDQPESYADYVHRIGRTGRAGQKGQALTFVN